MTIHELQKEHDLKKDVDFWHHQQSGQWILKHSAVEKIANKQGIKLVDLEPLNSEMDLVRFKVTMSLPNGGTIKSIGEADRNNCFSQYLGCMAEKRGVDRCVLKGINAYQYDISSEVEAEDFRKPDSSNAIPVIEQVLADEAELSGMPIQNGSKKSEDAFSCPKCNKGMVDNRDIDGTAKLSTKGENLSSAGKPMEGNGLYMPLYKCEDKNCKGVIWKEPLVIEKSAEETFNEI
tara:strand:- start:376 stop:1077 length:702 start_codon:yes stop_codon:yes gene_type:complete